MANGNVEVLKISIEAEYKSALTGINKVKTAISELNKLSNTFKSFSNTAFNSQNKSSYSLTTLNKNLNNTDKTLKNIQSTTKQTVNSFTSLQKKSNSTASKIKSDWSGLKSFLIKLGIGAVIQKSITDAIAAPETENLFRVAFKDLADDADRYAKSLSNAFGIDTFEIKQMLGTMQNFVTTLGIADKTASEISKTISYLSYEMSSLYNVDVQEIFTAIKAGFAGEIEPLRRRGILVDQNTLKQIAYNKGLAEYGAELNQQQRVMAVYYALLEQTSNAQGDLARTINLPVNQLRVLKSSVNEASRELGTAFIPLLQAITPIAIGVTKAITFLLNQLNKFVFSLAGLNYNEYIEEQKKVELGTNRITKSTNALGEEANKTGKKLKKALLPFDEIISLQEKQDEGLTGTTNLLPDFSNIQVPTLEPPTNITKNWEKVFKTLKDGYYKVYDWYRKYSTLINGLIKAISIVSIITKIGKSVNTLSKTILPLINNFNTLRQTNSIWRTMLSLINPVTLKIGLITAGIGVLVGTGVLITNYLNKPIIETGNIMEGLSQKTREAVSPFLELSYTADTELKKIVWSGTTLTDELANNITSKYDNMTTMITESLQKQKDEVTNTFTDMFNTSTSFSTEEQVRIFDILNQGYANRENLTKEYNEEIKNIIQKAAKEQRELTRDELIKIQELQIKMNQIGLEALSKNVSEQEVLLNRLKNSATTITSEQAAEIVKKSKETLDEELNIAERKYIQQKDAAERLRRMGGEEAEKEANKIIAEAERQRNQTYDKAKKRHNLVVEEAKKQAEKHVEWVDWETGTILSRWQVFFNKLKNLFNREKSNYTNEQWGVGRSIDKDVNVNTRYIANSDDIIAMQRDIINPVDDIISASSYVKRSTNIQPTTINNVNSDYTLMINKLDVLISTVETLSDMKIEMDGKTVAYLISEYVQRANYERGVGL